MGVKYVKDFSFPSSGGFHGDVQRYAKGGHVTKMPAKAKASAKDMPARAKPNAPAKGAPKMASKPAVGKRQGYDKGGRVPGREMDRLPTKRPPGRGKDLAPARPFKGKYEGYAEGGPVAEILPGDGMAPPSPMTPMPVKNFVMPPPGKGNEIGYKGGLEFVMPPPGKGPDVGGYPLPPDDPRLLPSLPPGYEPPPLGGDLRDLVVSTMPIPVKAPERQYPVGPKPPDDLDLPPVGALTPVPEEPYGRRSSGPPPPQGMKVNPNYGKPGQDYYVFIDDAARQDALSAARAALPSASAPRMERPEPIGLASMMPGAPVSRPPLAGEPGFGTSDALRRQMAAVKSGMDLQGTRGVKGSPLAEAARRAAVQGRAGVREDMGRRPAAAPAPKASRNALLRALASRMKAPTPRMGIPKPLPAVKPKPYMPVLNLAPEPLPPGFVSSPEARFAKGGAVKGKSKIGKVMREYKEGKLHSGSKKGPVVKSEKQAMAIALSEARKAGAKIPKKAEGGIFNDENMAYESKGPKTRYTAAKGRRQAKERAMERWAEQRQRHADAYAPGKSIDMPDKKKHGGMPVHRRKPMYGGGKC